MAVIPVGALRDAGQLYLGSHVEFGLTTSYHHRPVQALVSRLPRRPGDDCADLTHRRPGYGPVLSYLQAAQLETPLRIHPLLNLRTWDPKPYAKYLAWNTIEVSGWNMGSGFESKPARVLAMHKGVRSRQHPMFAAIWVDYDGVSQEGGRS